jgi:transposase
VTLIPNIPAASCRAGDYANTHNICSRSSSSRINEEVPSFKPRRWIVEVAHSWFNNFRKLKVRYEKSARNCLAFHHIAASFIALRRCHAVNGRNVIYR